MNLNKVNKHFVSDIDKHLAKFNRSNPKSASQQFEIDKYQDIHYRRDNAVTENPSKDALDDF